MAGLAQAGEPSRAEDAVAKEVEECAEELRVMVRLPMRRHKEWVAYLTGLLATLSETADAVEELIRQAGAHSMGELKRVRSSLDGMCNQVHSLLNEQQRAKDKAQAERAKAAEVSEEAPALSDLPPLEDRLHSMFRHLQMAVQGRGDLESAAVAREMEVAREDLRAVIGLPMRRHKQWVGYLEGLQVQLSEISDSAAILMEEDDNAPDQEALQRVAECAKSMRKRVQSLLNEQQRAAKRAAAKAAPEVPRIQLSKGLPLEERLAGVFAHLAEAHAAGRPADLEGAGEELEHCMQDVRRIMGLEMRRHRKWVAYLQGLQAQLREIVDLVLAVMRKSIDAGEAGQGRLQLILTTTDVMHDRVLSLLKEQQRMEKLESKARQSRAEPPAQSALDRRAQYERELHQYHLVASPKNRRARAGKKPYNQCALLTGAEGEMALTLAATGFEATLRDDLENTPMQRMKAKEADAAVLREEGRWEEEIHLRQELVALARLHCQFEDGPSVDSTALARSHVNLGSTYASIGYWKQAAIHAKRTLDELDKAFADGHSYDMIVQAAHALLGEALMNITPPRSVLAMDHLRKAYPEDDEGAASPALASMLARCHGQLGSSAAALAVEAGKVARRVREEISAAEKRHQEVAGDPEKEEEAFRLGMQLRSLRNAEAEVRAEVGAHCTDADPHLNKAVDFLMDCIDRQERAIKDAGEEPDRHEPELRSMYWQGAQHMLELAEVKELQGCFGEALSLLDEILRLQRVYSILDKRKQLLCDAQRHRGTALVKLGRVDDAVEAYEELLKLQAGLPNQNAAARAAGPGETHKLLGNLLLARRDFEGAGEHYGEALQLARAAFGQEHPKTQDLVKRLSSLQDYQNSCPTTSRGPN